MNEDDELWQGYSEEGELVTDKGVTKLAARRDGVLHGCSHLWIWRLNNGVVEILLQRRAFDKPTWAGFYDISSAGHTDFGETPLQAIVRETQEELGLTIDTKLLKLLFVHRAYMVDPASKYIENEFRWVYGLVVDDELAINADKSEVESTTWMSLDEVKNLVANPTPDRRIVPQGPAYFTSLFEEIDRLLGGTAA